MFSLPLSSLFFLVKPKGNQWTLAKTGQARAQSKQRAKIQSTARTNKHTETHWQYLICQDIHMLEQSSWRHFWKHTASSLVVLSMLNMHAHTHMYTHTNWAAVCLFCSFTALTQLQLAVRQDSQGRSKKCQHILHLTFPSVGSLLRLSILSWSSELIKEQSCWAIYQQSSATAKSDLYSTATWSSQHKDCIRLC